MKDLFEIFEKNKKQGFDDEDFFGFEDESPITFEKPKGRKFDNRLFKSMYKSDSYLVNYLSNKQNGEKEND
jgi:hypothetical protein